MIDDIDRRILMLLQEDARLSNAALAKEVGLTVSTVHERVKKLERHHQRLCSAGRCGRVGPADYGFYSAVGRGIDRELS